MINLILCVIFKKQNGRFKMYNFICFVCQFVTQTQSHIYATHASLILNVCIRSHAGNSVKYL